MDKQITEPAYGKINLTLEVLGTRPDGYHEIKSIMQSVELHDTLTFESTADSAISLTGSDSRLKYDGSNLVIKAAEALRMASGASLGARIHLEKNIPIEAGMAGGSADAAATLRGLNRLWGLDFSQDRLREIGAAVGSDIPFCLAGGTAMVEGRGERVRPIAGPAPMALLVVKPEFGASTARVYAGFDNLDQPEFEDHSALLETALSEGKDFRAFLYNDLQKVTTALYPEVREILDEMGRTVRCRLMSGSGPTCLCFGEPDELQSLYVIFSKRYKDVFLTMTR